MYQNMKNVYSSEKNGQILGILAALLQGGQK